MTNLSLSILVFLIVTYKKALHVTQNIKFCQRCSISQSFSVLKVNLTEPEVLLYFVVPVICIN